MKEAIELKKLTAQLSSERPEVKITFREESARDTRYTLVVATGDNILLRKLARLFGCPVRRLPGTRDARFEAADDWHGRGEVNLRCLADEFMGIRGEFFDFDTTVAELRSLVPSTPLTEFC